MPSEKGSYLAALCILECKEIKCFLSALGPGVYSASNRNEYQKNNNVSGK
jgi:hypothetical protein